MKNEGRRAFDRFEARHEVFALLKPACDRLGQVRDVSEGGLAFEYMKYEGMPLAPEDRATLRLDLILGQENVLLSQIPCEIVYDMELSRGERDSGGGIEGVRVRRCGLRFGRLSHEQRAAISEFILNYASTGKDGNS